MHSLDKFREYLKDRHEVRRGLSEDSRDFC